MPGLQVRSNAQANHVLHFIKAKDIGTIVQGRAHWHKRDTWRRAASTPEREKEMNWRLTPKRRPALIGEIGIHQIDTASRYLNALPVAVTGFSSLKTSLLPSNGGEYKDDRNVPTAAQCILEYPNGVTYFYDASLHQLVREHKIMNLDMRSSTLRGRRFYCAISARGCSKSPTLMCLGWEGFARVDSMPVGKPENGSGEKMGAGIALVADATKQIARGKKPGEIGTDVSKTSLYQAIDAFVTSISHNKKPDVGPLEGYQATVVAHKCNEAALKQIAHRISARMVCTLVITHPITTRLAFHMPFLIHKLHRKGAISQ